MQTNTQDTILKLKQQGAFLALSRTQPDLFSTAFQFHLNQNTIVSVIAEGIIMFEPTDETSKDLVLSCGVHQ